MLRCDPSVCAPVPSALIDHVGDRIVGRGVQVCGAGRRSRGGTFAATLAWARQRPSQMKIGRLSGVTACRNVTTPSALMGGSGLLCHLVIGAIWVALALSIHRVRHRRQPDRCEQTILNE